MRIWGRASSINVQKVLWLADEIGLTYDAVPAGGDHGGLDSAAFLALNPHGRIPVLEDGEVVVWESHAILRYLAAAHGAARFWPDAPARARIDGWMDWSQTAWQIEVIGGLFWGWWRTPPQDRDARAVASSLRRASAHARLLDRRLADRPWLAGEDFSLADIPAGALLHRWFGMDIERPATPHLKAWYARLAERPAYRARVMIPFDDLRGRLAF